MSTKCGGGFAFTILWILAVVVTVAAGCSGGSRGRPTKPVSVTVTYKGLPVADATVTLMSQDGEPIAAFGQTDAQGVAKLNTPELGPARWLANTRPRSSKRQIVNPKTSVSQDSPSYAPPSPDVPPPQVKREVPAKYSAPDTSPLTADVSRGGPNEFKFELTDQRALGRAGKGVASAVRRAEF